MARRLVALVYLPGRTPVTRRLDDLVQRPATRTPAMIVVSATSPLNYLILVHCEHVLPQLLSLSPRSLVSLSLRRSFSPSPHPRRRPPVMLHGASVDFPPPAR